jgi:hypothetical protein
MSVINNGYPQLTAYLLSVLLNNDRRLRTVGSPRDRQEWGIERLGDYFRAIGQETLEEGGETAIWQLVLNSLSLLPSRREEALVRLVRFWGPLPGWLDDQKIPPPARPSLQCWPELERRVG